MDQYLHNNLIKYAKSSEKNKYNEWDLINHQKIIEQKVSKSYQSKIQQQKKQIQQRNYLQNQVNQRKEKEQAIKKQELMYSNRNEQLKRRSRQLQQLNKKKRFEQYKQMNSQNKEIINNYSNDKKLNPPKDVKDMNPNFIDNVHCSQNQRIIKRQEQRNKITDQLQKQIKEKQMIKSQIKQQEKVIDKQYLNYQIKWFKERNQRQRYKFSHTTREVEDKYNTLVQNNKEKEEAMYRKIVQESEQSIKEEERKKNNEKNQKNKQNNQKLKEYLQNQMRQKQQNHKKQSPEVKQESLVQKMLLQQRKSYLSKKQEQKDYFKQLQRQIQEKKWRNEQNRYMNEQEYKINLSHLNSLVGGKHPQDKYIDRSMHSIGHDNKANTTLLETDFKKHLQLNAIKDKVQELRSKSIQKQSSQSQQKRPYYHSSLLF